MRILSSVILVALGLLALFTALNWSVLTMPTDLSFGVFTLAISPGLVLLTFALGFALTLIGYVATQRTAIFMEARRHAEEIKAQREITDRVEASRLQDLRLQLEREMSALRVTIEESANGLAASIGEVEDKLDRALQRSTADGLRTELT